MKIATSLLLALVALASTACSGSSDEASSGAPGAETEDELRGGALVQGAAAVTLDIKAISPHVADKSVTFGAKKLATVLSHLKKRSPAVGLPRCMATHSTTLSFLDDAAKEVASANILCGAGTLAPKGKAAIQVSLDLQTLDLANEELVPGDALWGITSIEVKDRAGHKTKDEARAAQVKDLLRAIDFDQKIDPTRPMPRCMPNFSITFKRGPKEAAWASFSCGTGAAAPARVAANFGIYAANADADADPLASGAIDLDPRPFLDLL